MYVFFFFQAEDGIRDLVRSRGLGDVYKRQVMATSPRTGIPVNAETKAVVIAAPALGPSLGVAPVSYTHLTLPTSDLV